VVLNVSKMVLGAKLATPSRVTFKGTLNHLAPYSEGPNLSIGLDSEVFTHFVDQESWMNTMWIKIQKNASRGLSYN
jgi:hypothetical protein